jgi:hypothetical protein
VDLGVLVEAERQTRSRDLGGAAMCVAPAIAAPRAGVEILAAVGASVGLAAPVAAAGASGVVAVAAGASGVVAVAAGAGGGDAGRVCISLFSLAKEALRRKCRCVEAPEMLLTLHQLGPCA